MSPSNQTNVLSSSLRDHLVHIVDRGLPASLSQPLRVAARGLREWNASRDLEPLVERVRPFTMLSDAGLLALGRQVRQVLKDQIPGALVECGVWKGGAAFLMASIVREASSDRRVWLLDSFEGLPAPGDIDGADALKYARTPDDPRYRDNCRAAIEEVRVAARELGLAETTEFVKGWFENTLPEARGRIGPVALLRIDADWYSSVRCCLDNLYDLVSPGGFIVLDDYEAWDGCVVATHEFLGHRKLPHRIFHDGGCAYFRKQ